MGAWGLADYCPWGHPCSANSFRASGCIELEMLGFTEKRATPIYTSGGSGPIDTNDAMPIYTSWGSGHIDTDGVMPIYTS